MPIDITGSDRIEVVGESFYRPALRELSAASTGSQVGRLYQAALVCDPANPYDRNAVKVMVEGRHVGHLPRELAALVTDRISELTSLNGEVTCAAEIRGSGPEFGQGVVLSVDFDYLGLVVSESDEMPVEDVDPAFVATVSKESSPEKAEGTENSSSRQATIERAVEDWKSELIDLTARNRLLYMRDLRTGTLSFDSSAREALMQLVAGNRVALSKLIPRTRLPEVPGAELTPFEDAVRSAHVVPRLRSCDVAERPGKQAAGCPGASGPARDPGTRR